MATANAAPRIERTYAADSLQQVSVAVMLKPERLCWFGISIVSHFLRIHGMKVEKATGILELERKPIIRVTGTVEQLEEAFNVSLWYTNGLKTIIHTDEVPTFPPADIRQYVSTVTGWTIEKKDKARQ